MRTLTESEIEKLASRKGVRRIAVKNFLGTMADYGVVAAQANLKYDGKIYQWSPATVAAIMAGIRMASQEGK